MSTLRINNITDRLGQSGTEVVGVCTVTSTGAFRIASGDSAHRGGRGRGVFAGGIDPAFVTTMDYIEIPSTGNAVDFGDISAAALSLIHI